MQVRNTFSFMNKSSLLIAILVIFYTVGIVGLLLPEYHDYFLSLSFFNLMLSFGIVLIARMSKISRFLLFMLVCIAYGFIAKMYGVPRVIGVNWALLIVSSASLVNTIKTTLFVRSVLAALLMTLLDVLIEPVAIESDFWHWTNGSIPLYNYISWFFVALPIIYAYFKLNLAETNKVFNALFILMILFFTILLIF